MYVSEICAEGIFVTFPWWLKNVKSRSKIALFSNERHFEIWFPKKRTITFFWSKLSKLHKKDPILHVATTLSLKQGETRISHEPIPHPLKMHTPKLLLAYAFNWMLFKGLSVFDHSFFFSYCTCRLSAYVESTPYTNLPTQQFLQKRPFWGKRDNDICSWNQSSLVKKKKKNI